MKKMGLVLSLILLSIGLFACQQDNEGKVDNTQVKTESLEKITIYPMKSNSETLVIGDTETIAMLKNAVDNMVKQAGIINMANPEFRIEIGEETYFLWIDEKSGVVMNSEDTHMIYSLSETSLKQVNGLLNGQDSARAMIN